MERPKEPIIRFGATWPLCGEGSVAGADFNEWRDYALALESRLRQVESPQPIWKPVCANE